MAEEQNIDEQAPQEVPVEEPPPPCPILSTLYGSSRPAVELLPGVNLSPILNACWLLAESKAMLAESWFPKPPEDNGDAPAATPPTFDPAAADYNELQRRLSKSAAMVQWNNLTIRIKEIENELPRLENGERDVRLAELEEAKAKLTETDGLLVEVKASFQDDALALTPWMQTLFDLADAGLTTFDVSGNFWPHSNIRELFSGNNSRSYYEGVEQLLGTFKKRYEKERGPNTVQLLTKLVPNIFHDEYSPEVADRIIEKMRSNLFGSDSAEALDLVQLYWFDFKIHDVIPTLKVLQKLSEDKVEVNEETGEITILEPKKIKGIGLVDFPYDAIKSAIQAGVRVTSVQMSYCITDVSQYKVLELAREYNIKVFARDGLMGGLINVKYLGAPCPDSLTVDPDLDNVNYCLGLIAHYGGWDKVQKLLNTLQAVADKHGVKMQSVALRWQMDQGCFPVATVRWAPRCWKQFGYWYWTEYLKPAVDSALFQKESFLDSDDVDLLSTMCNYSPRE